MPSAVHDARIESPDHPVYRLSETLKEYVEQLMYGVEQVDYDSAPMMMREGFGGAVRHWVSSRLK